MPEVSGLKAIHARKQALLMESELNRQVLNLECQRITLRWDRFRQDWATAPWKIGLALLGLVVALRVKPAKKFLGSSFGLFFLRRLWELLTKSRLLEKKPGS